MATTVSNTDTLDKEISQVEAQLRELTRQRAHADRACADTALPDEKTSADTTLRRQQHLRRGIIPYLRDYNWRVILTAPVIYATAIPLAFLDLSLTLYQWICFPAYRIKRVKRSEFIVIDRHQLAYLNTLEKLNCVFCGYANGLLAYAHEIASRTERFWCPIKHAAMTRGQHRRTSAFVEYEDGAGYRNLQRDNAARSRSAPCGPGGCDACKL